MYYVFKVREYLNGRGRRNSDSTMVFRVVHRGPLLQRGNGLGSLFRSLFKAVIPLAKSGARTLMNTGIKAAKSSTGRKLVGAMKKEVKKSGIKALGNLITGEDVVKGMREDLGNARKRIGRTLLNDKDSVEVVEGEEPATLVGRKRKRRMTYLKPKKRRKRRSSTMERDW